MERTVVSVVVTPATVSFASLGDTEQLTATARDASNNAVTGVSFTWSSSDDDCAAVNSAGLVTSAGNGSVTITVATAGVSATVSVTVAQVVAAVAVTPSSMTLTSTGETAQLAASAQDANGHEVGGPDLTWESSDESVATVNATGLVTSAGNGTATITVASGGVSATASVTVAQVVAAVAVTPSSITLTSMGETAQLAASAQDANGHEAGSGDFTWESSDESVATVDATGLVTARENGSATISASLEGVATPGEADITVDQRAASVVVSPIGASISGVGATQQFVLEARDAGGSLIPDPSATWSSLNSNVATIDASTGQATVVESGQVTIAAEVDGVVEYALLTVAVPGAEPVNLWSEMPGGSGASGVWGSSVTDIFATHEFSVLHYDGTHWSTMATQAGSYGYGIWGTSATDVYAVFNGIQHYDGTSWTTMGVPVSDLKAVWGTSPKDVFAVGGSGTIIHYDGTTWSTMASGTFGDFEDVWGTSARNVYAVGDLDRILHYDGVSWTAAYETQIPLHGLWGTSSNDVYAVGWGGAVLHYDGTAWSEMTSGTGTPFEAVWGTSSTDIYALGWSGSIFHNDGTKWSEMQTGIGEIIVGAWGMSATDVYAVQRVDVILRGVRGASVVVTPREHSLVGAGATVQLAAEARDAGDNAISGVKFAWRSSDLSVATVDATGLVTAVASGVAMITATVPGGARDTATITVDLGQPITPGVWHGTTGSGFSFDFTVDAGADYVTQVQYFWSGLSCEGLTHVSGSTTVSRNPGWSIAARQFTVEPQDYPAITATFDDAGTAASGSWQWLSCSGTWTAIP